MSNDVYIPQALKQSNLLESEKIWLVKNISVYNTSHFHKNEDGTIEMDKLFIAGNQTITHIEVPLGKVDEIDIIDCSLFNSLKNFPIESSQIHLESLPELTSLKGMSRIANKIVLSDLGITSYETLPRHLNKLTIRGCNQVTSIKGLPLHLEDEMWLQIQGDHLQNIESAQDFVQIFGKRASIHIYTKTNNLRFPALGCLTIKNLEYISFPRANFDDQAQRASWVINDFLKLSDPSYHIDKCYEILCEKGLSDYAYF